VTISLTATGLSGNWTTQDMDKLANGPTGIEPSGIGPNGFGPSGITPEELL
jgi:hypothetical protein